MTFKKFIDTYGLIGYPFHKISNVFKSLTGDKIHIYNTEIEKIISNKYKELQRNIKMIKGKKHTKDELLKMEEDYITDFLNDIKKNSMNLYYELTKKSNDKEKDEIKNRHDTVIKNIEINMNKYTSSNKNKYTSSFTQKYGL